MPVHEIDALLVRYFYALRSMHEGHMERSGLISFPLPVDEDCVSFFLLFAIMAMNGL